MRNVHCSSRERVREIFSVHKKDLTKWVNEEEEDNDDDDDGYEQAVRIKKCERERKEEEEKWNL